MSLLDAMMATIPEPEKRRAVYEPFLYALKDEGWELAPDIQGIDPAFDATVREYDPGKLPEEVWGWLEGK